MDIQELKSKTKTGKQTRSRSYGSGRRVTGYSSSAAETRRDAREELAELAEAEDYDIKEIAAHLEELASATKKYPEEECDHARDLLYEITDGDSREGLVISTLKAHLEELTSEQNRNRSIKLVKQNAEVVKQAVSAFKSATKEGKETRSRSIGSGRRVTGYSSSAAETRKDARKKLAELGMLAEDDTADEVASHLKELATNTKKYPSEERDHARDLLYRMAGDDSRAEFVESTLKAHLEELTSEQNRIRSVELAKQNAEVVKQAVSAFKSATKEGKETRSRSIGSGRRVTGYSSSAAETRRDAREKLVELGSLAEDSTADEVASHLEELATDTKKYPSEERDHAVTCLIELDLSRDAQYIKPILGTEPCDIRAGVIERLPRVAEKSSTNLTPYVDALFSIITNDEEKISLRVPAAETVAVVIDNHSEVANDVDEYTLDLDDVLFNQIGENEDFRVAVARILTVIGRTLSGTNNVCRSFNEECENYSRTLSKSGDFPAVRAETVRALGTVTGNLDSNPSSVYAKTLVEQMGCSNLDNDVSEAMVNALLGIAESNPESVAEQIDDLLPDTSREEAKNIGQIAGKIGKWDPDTAQPLVEEVGQSLSTNAPEKPVLLWLCGVSSETPDLIAPYVSGSIAPLLTVDDSLDNSDSIRRLTASILGYVESECPGTIEEYTNELEVLLDHPDDEHARQNAAWALGQLAKTAVEAVEPYAEQFVDNLNSELEWTRRQNAFALSVLASESSETVAPWVETLASHLDDKCQMVRLYSVEALSGVAENEEHADKVISCCVTNRLSDSHEFRTSVIATLHDNHEPTRKASASVLYKLAEYDAKKVVPHVSDLIYRLRDKSISVRARSVYVLGRIARERPNAVIDHHQQIAQLLDEEELAIARENAAYTLGELAQPHPETIEEHVENLRTLLSDNRIGARIDASWALSHLQIDSVVREDIIETLSTSDVLDYKYSHMRQRAVETLVELKAFTALELLRERRNQESDTDVATAIETAIDTLEDIAREKAKSFADAADQHDNTALEARSKDDYQAAAEAFDDARTAYEEARDIVAGANLNQEKQTYETKVETAIEGWVWSRRDRLKKCRESIASELSKHPNEAYDDLQSLLNEIEELADDCERLGEQDQRQRVESIEQRVREDLWRAHFEPFRQDIQDAREARKDQDPYVASRKLNRIKNALNNDGGPPEEAREPDNGDDRESLLSTCESLIEAIKNGEPYKNPLLPEDAPDKSEPRDLDKPFGADSISGGSSSPDKGDNTLRDDDTSEENVTGTALGITNQVPKLVRNPPTLSVTWECFEREELINDGGYAEVYRETLPDADRPVAVKITPDSQQLESGESRPTEESPEAKILHTEANRWRRLQKAGHHDHIVRLYDSGTVPTSWLALEYMDGGTLADRIEYLSVKELLWIGNRIADAVFHAHRHMGAHHDITPHNILFRETPTDGPDWPKLADWGLAEFGLEDRKTVDAFSQAYAAPEQLDMDGYGEPNQATDIYQLGAVLYEALTGEPRPSATEQPTAPSNVSSIPGAVDEVITKALDPVQNARHSSMVHFRDSLETILRESFE